jgi:hypothetical protein
LNSQRGAQKVSQYKYSLQLNVTLFNPKTCFFGRTYRGKQMPLRTIPEANELLLDDSDWVMFYTQAKAIDTKAVVEVILIEHDILKSTHKSKGLGYAVVPLFYEELPPEVDLWRGSPRDVLKHMNDIGHEPPRADSVLNFEVRKLPTQKLQFLMSLLPDNTLVGSSDELPGIKGSILPPRVEEVISKTKPSEVQTLFAHNVRISSMNEIEQTFN